MPKLPSSNTTIRDQSQYNNIGDGVTGVNIATIINPRTGPFTRKTLTSFDDLTKYYCTGSTVSQKDDVTVQCVGAMLNYAALDVIRVGNANIRVGKTNDNKTIYTDSNYKFLNQLNRFKFVNNYQREESLCVEDSSRAFYVGNEPTKKGDEISLNTRKLSNDNTLTSLAFGLYKELNAFGYDLTNEELPVVIFKDEPDLRSTYLTNVQVNFDDVAVKISVNSDTLTANDNTYALNLGNQLVWFGSNPEMTGFVIEPLYDLNANVKPMKTSKFLAFAAKKFDANKIAAFNIDISFDVTDIYAYDRAYASSTDTNILASDVNWDATNKKYHLTDKLFKSFYFTKTVDGKPVHYLYNLNPVDFGWSQDNITEIENDDGELIENDTNDKFVVVESNTESGMDLLNILYNLERTTKYYKSSADYEQIDLFTVNDDITIYSYNGIANEVSSKTILNFDFNVEGLYKVGLTKTDEISTNYWVFYNGTVYYNGASEPNLDSNYDVKEYVQISEDDLLFKEFIAILFEEFQNDSSIGLVARDTLLTTSTKVELAASDNITVRKAIIDQTIKTKDSKFALVGTFPSDKPLFDYTYQRNDSVTDYDVIDVDWTYNQISGKMTFSFDPDSVDGSGTALYYTKYNEGVDENEYMHIIQFNDFVKFDKKDNDGINEVFVDNFGDEIYMPEPTATSYAAALQKFIKYNDKQYSFIWDSGYANPVLAKAMAKVGLKKNAQFVPSFPLNYTETSEFLSYHKSLGINSHEGYEIVPAFKGTFCGSFLTTVPAGLAYIAARVQSFDNTSLENQPLFGPKRGVVAAPNLVANLDPDEQQVLMDSRINYIVNDLNGTYINFNITSYAIESSLNEEQNVYITNTIAHTCQEFNPSTQTEQNDDELWTTVINQLGKKLNERVIDGKKPTAAGIRVLCDDKLNDRNSRTLKYKVQVQYKPTTAYVDAYVDVVRLGTF